MDMFASPAATAASEPNPSDISAALGMERLLVTPLARFRQGTPIRLEQGVLFTTYATLRTDAREERVSRVHQIVDWLGSGFDGVIVFDESHAMANATSGKDERGDQTPSQQGRAGLLQLRRAKVMGAFRVEPTGFTDGMVERLKAKGLVSEIIAWKLRLFVPTAANGPTILGTLMERLALVRIGDRAAA